MKVRLTQQERQTIVHYLMGVRNRLSIKKESRELKRLMHKFRINADCVNIKPKYIAFIDKILREVLGHFKNPDMLEVKEENKEKILEFIAEYTVVIHSIIKKLGVERPEDVVSEESNDDEGISAEAPQPDGLPD